MDPRYVKVENGIGVLRLRCTKCNELVDEWGPMDGEALVFAMVRESLRHACRTETGAADAEAIVSEAYAALQKGNADGVQKDT